MNFKEYADREMLTIDLANKLAGELTEALEHEERVLFAVPGGTTPGPVFDDLCAVDLDWSRVDVMLTDERWVPEDHARSNTRLLRERLLVDRAAAARYVPMYLPGDTPDARLADLETNIVPNLPINVLLLGMGDDMHTASLFPGADTLKAALAADAPVLMAVNAPGAPEPRVTLTARVLDGALSKHIVILGEAKRAALERARKSSAEEAPVAAVLTETEVHWAP